MTRASRVLFRTFFAQFFASESVTSDIQLRQTIIWVLALLVAPCLVLAIELFPHFQFVAIRAIVVAVAGVALACHLLGRRRARGWSVEPPDELTVDRPDFTVLDIGAIVRPLPAVNRGAL
jgi:hypothetical protein